MSRENLFGDLLKIAGGNLSLASERVGQFRDFANTVPGSAHGAREPNPTSKDANDKAAAGQPESGKTSEG